MDYINKILQDESGTAEAASSAVMIGMVSGLWSGGLTGIWDNLLNSNSEMILVGCTLAFIWWAVFKA